MTYAEQRKIIIDDLKGKLHRQDWHGVADCAMDLRELEAEWRGLNAEHVELKGERA